MTRNWQFVLESELSAAVAYKETTIILGKQKVWKTFLIPAVVVAVTDPIAKTTYVGTARCSPDDKYNPKLGREIATGRALKLMHESRSQVLLDATVEIRDGITVMAYDQADMRLFKQEGKNEKSDRR